MVQLRIDVEAANARAQFEATARTVDRLADELDDAQDEAANLRREFHFAGMEADRLQRQVAQTDRRLEQLRSTARAMGRMMPDNLRQELQRTERASRELHRELDRAEASARRAGQAMNTAEHNAARLADEFDDAERQAAQLRREMERTARAAATNSAAIRRAFAGLGEDGRRAGRNFMGTMGPAIIGGAVALGPLVGAAVSAGILTALGGGAVAAAAALAVKQSDALQSAFSRAFRNMGDEASVWAGHFDHELFAVSDRFGKAWDKISDNLGAAFKQAQKYVEPFAEGISQLVERMFGGGGFNAAMEAAEPVIKAFSTGLADTGDALNSFFDSIADGGEGEVEGMIALFAALTAAIRLVGNTLEFLSKAFDFMTDAGEKVASSMELIVTGLEGVSALLPGVADGWGFVKDAFATLNGEAGKTKDLMPIVGAATSGTSHAMDMQAAAAQKAAKAAYDLSQKLHGLISDQLSADQAALQWEIAIDAVTAAIQENGRTIDTNTAKGQANVGTVLQAIAAAQQMYEAAIELAGGEHASSEAVAAANAAYAAQIERLRATLRAAGLTEQQIDALLRKYEQMANAPDITKRVNVIHTTYFREVGGPNYNKTAGNQVAYASGTSSARAGVALVGEDGPELVRFGGGEQVYPADQTARMLAGGRPAAATGSGGGQMQLVAAGGPRSGNNFVVQVVEEAIKRGWLKLRVSRTSSAIQVG